VEVGLDRDSQKEPLTAAVEIAEEIEPSRGDDKISL
jgi:hypothetical protein